MRRVMWIAGAGVIGLLLCGGAAMSGATSRPAGHCWGGHFGGGKIAALRSKLNLSDDQVSQIRTVLKNNRTEIAGAMKPVMEKRRALVDLVLAQNTDEAAIRAAADDLGKSIGDAAVVKAKVHKEIAPILTPEQTKKMEEIRAKHREKMDARLNKMGEQQPESK